MKGRAVWSTLAVVLVLAVGFVDSTVTGLARDNLSNATFPRTHERTPWQMGIPASNVTIPSDGLRLAGWWMPAEPGSTNASTTIVLVHGVSSQMGKPVRMWAPFLHAAGYSLLAIDLRNHGASDDGAQGYVTYGVREADDVLSAMAWVQGHAADLGVDPDRIVLYGMSMGAASVLNAAGREPAGLTAVMADSSYASFVFQARVDGAHKGYPQWVIDLVVHRMDALAPAPPSASRPDEALAQIELPVFLASCSNDERVTRPNFDRLDLAAPSISGLPSGRWIEPCPTGLSKDHHVDGAWQPGYNATVLGFLDDALHRPPEG
jgi:pimeloyl-ACP methyl ester carboxylesterase